MANKISAKYKGYIITEGIFSIKQLTDKILNFMKESAYDVYLEFTEEWRDILPHISQFDILASNKFKVWRNEKKSQELYFFERLCNKLNEYTPNGCRFGLNDMEDKYGFWIKEITETIVLVKMKKGKVINVTCTDANSRVFIVNYNSKNYINRKSIYEGHDIQFDYNDMEEVINK